MVATWYIYLENDKDPAIEMRQMCFVPSIGTELDLVPDGRACVVTEDECAAISRLDLNDSWKVVAVKYSVTMRSAGATQYVSAHIRIQPTEGGF